MRITIKHLQAAAREINVLTGSPTEYSTMQKGLYVANVGHFAIDQGLNGFMLERVTSTTGGVTHPLFNAGHMPARQLHDLMLAFIAGLKWEKRQ